MNALIIRCLSVGQLISAFILASGFAGPAASADTLAITRVNVIDATGALTQPEMAVVVQDGRISALGKSSVIMVPPDAKTVDGSGKYLIPGLWDMHVHTVFGDWIPRDEKVMLPLFVANGVTGVRDMAGDLDVLKQWLLRYCQIGFSACDC